VYPALAVAEAVRTHYPGSKLHFVGNVDGFERPLVEQGGVSFDSYDEVQAGPVHGVKPQRMVKSAFEMVVGTGQAARLLRAYRPGAVLLTGGFVGFPVALAAWLLRVPVLMFVPDIEPALSIKVLRRLTTRVALAIPESAAYFADGQTVVTGYPVRMELAQSERAAAMAHFGLDPARKTLLVFGGSRGARSINQALVPALPRLLALDVQVLHVTGTLDYERVQADAATLPDATHYHPYAYLHDDMGLALAAADLVLSRAGAGSLGEFPLFGLPAVLVPYPHAWRYQKVNADYLAERGAAVVLADEDMAADLYPLLERLFTNAEPLATMQAQMETLAQPHSARRVAAVLAELTGKGGEQQ